MQLITDFLALIAAAVAALGTVGTALWFLIGMRVAPVQRDVYHLGKRVDNLSGDVSNLRADMNAKFSELNGKFDILLTLLREKPEIESLAGVGASNIPACASKEPAE